MRMAEIGGYSMVSPPYMEQFGLQHAPCKQLSLLRKKKHMGKP